MRLQYYILGSYLSIIIILYGVKWRLMNAYFVPRKITLKASSYTPAGRQYGRFFQNNLLSILCI